LAGGLLAGGWRLTEESDVNPRQIKNKDRAEKMA
jgi:hypothetical protein